MNEIIMILVQRDGISIKEAERKYINCKLRFEAILRDELGLNLDYLQYFK